MKRSPSALATQFAVLFAAALPAGAVPVDLRTLNYPSTATAAPAAVTPGALSKGANGFFAGCEIMATREIINELIPISELHQNEALSLDLDALDLWNQWRNTFGQIVPGRDQTRQIEAFNLHQAARLTMNRSRDLMDGLEKIDAAWWKLWRLLDAAAKAGKDGADLKPQLDKFRGRLSKLADDSNAVDASIRANQALYDFTRPPIVDSLAARGVSIEALRQPWHWNYAIVGNPRPDLRYDFDESYEKHYAASHEWLRTKGLIK